MSKTAAREQKTLQSELHQAFKSYRGGCSHVENDVTKVLERYGLLDMAEPDLRNTDRIAACGFCSSTEVELKHATWCVEAK